MMTREQLMDMRDVLKVTQGNMANAMGMPQRTYEDIEAGRSEFRPVHERAALFAAMTLIAADPSKVNALPHENWHLIRLLYRIGIDAKILIPAGDDPGDEAERIIQKVLADRVTYLEFKRRRHEGRVPLIEEKLARLLKQPVSIIGYRDDPWAIVWEIPGSATGRRTTPLPTSTPS